MNYAYQLKGIQYYYDKTLALDLPELKIQANKITALIGPNGCGKSTLLNLLALIQKNQQGEMYFFSNLVRDRQIPELIKDIAFLAQKPYMLQGTVSENLALSLKFHNINNNQQTIIDSTLDKLGINHLKHLQAKTLSGGELQKTALARAIVSNPDVLLMDEPFSYLDNSSEKLLEQFISDFVKKDHKTLIFSTHNRLQGIAIADEVISLVKGKPVKTQLINLFQGINDKQLFNTGKIKILLPDGNQTYRHVSIDPHEIVLSKQPLISSMRNQFQGKVTGIADESGVIRVTLSAGEVFQVLITHQAFLDMAISIADQLWINFKSNVVLAF